MLHGNSNSRLPHTQIEVTFDIDANDILNATEVEKQPTKKTRSQSPTTKDVCLRKVNEAEKYRAEDDKQKETISAKNALESYCFNIKATMEDDKLKDKLAESDKTLIMDKWLDANQ
uniref:CSON012688 protein n=1 Tax=Culicoides sonorensis TaxID=179676 RepID=A0A336KLX2_CULSO